MAPEKIARREFGKLAIATVGAAAFADDRIGASGWAATPGVKLCVQSSANPTADELLFLKQIGALYVSVAAPEGMRTANGFVEIKKRYADAGVTVWNIGRSEE